MFTITKEFSFSASHALCHLPAEHPCHNLHGHNYKVKLELRANELADGFVVDYRKLQFVKDWIDSTLDHKHLNDIYPMTTVECMSREIFNHIKPHLPELYAVELSETDKTNCRYEPS